MKYILQNTTILPLHCILYTLISLVTVVELLIIIDIIISSILIIVFLLQNVLINRKRYLILTSI